MKYHFVLGDNNAECDVCGWEWKASKLRRRWDGVYACPNCFEHRPQQDMVRGVKEGQPPEIIRIDQPDKAVTGYLQALAGATAITNDDLGTDNRVVVDVMEQITDVYEAGAVTITIASSVVTGDTVVINGVSTRGVSVSVVDNSVGATIVQVA